MAVLPPELTYPEKLEEKEERANRINEKEEEIYDTFFENENVRKAIAQLKDNIEEFKRYADEDDVQKLIVSLADGLRDYLLNYDKI